MKGSLRAILLSSSATSRCQNSTSCIEAASLREVVAGSERERALGTVSKKTNGVGLSGTAAMRAFSQPSSFCEHKIRLSCKV